MTSLSIAPVAERPSWRGWLHTVTFLAAIPGGILLIVVADTAAGTVGASIYMAGLLLGFGTSAGYHRLAQSDRARRIMQRLDHSMIFVLIAATYTPICLVGLPPEWGIPILSVAWAGALLGIALKQFAFDKLKVLEYALYPGLGWIVVVAGPVLVDRLTTAQLVLLIAGGLLYTVGIPVLVRERPNPWPRTFGYHEIWHGFTVAAGACHFATVALLVA
ncbi:MAG TPA: hemolysin III [Acidimicrobiaceae bacterium]|nr:hemolysin III [Acidimicrobiaceae bacterium]